LVSPLFPETSRLLNLNHPQVIMISIACTTMVRATFLVLQAKDTDMIYAWRVVALRKLIHNCFFEYIVMVLCWARFRRAQRFGRCPHLAAHDEAVRGQPESEHLSCVDSQASKTASARRSAHHGSARDHRPSAKIRGAASSPSMSV
jgi:hypothetical protein